MSFIDRVQADLVSAMKNRDELALSVLRMLKSALQVAQTEKGRGGEISEDAFIAIVQRLIKQREEAAEQYRSCGASERADSEIREADFLRRYLPEQLSDQDLAELIARVASDIGALGPKDMGRLMGQLMPKVKGRADGNRVKDRVSAYLASLGN
ncbi:hypothetical protein TheveDRAFT_1167 [Thermanaerovibrio velox DSM 12556]|uniref:GatB/YqeY domain-containing protein n=1 Tax=Thermanaerovibrio velox DSM 12556 TaxID=926567 RepID=H0USK2_9BACT|nr:GatB/YqeY domain-containing protein [Thermanaerovibrio velox]EHM10291.1 hypothetical protein TheveDRAFT_1167 [Thermanaerovibrio velox DSM 12556]